MSGLFAGRGRRAWLRAGCAVVLLVGMYFVAPLHLDDAGTACFALRSLALVAGLAVVTWLVTLQVRRSLQEDRLLGERVALLLTLVTVVVVFFAGVYFQMAGQFAGLGTRLDALYFSMTTLATVGYGDITATGQTARALVTVQMAFDLIIVTTAVSLIVSALGGASGRKASADEPH